MKYSLEELQQGKVFLIDKPLDWTSFQAVNKIKWKIINKFPIKKIKVGHAGTLDPKATGLLVVCVGKATKTIEQIQGQKKVYTGTLKLGATTACYDTEMEESEFFPTEHISDEMIFEAAKKYTGTIHQLPPIFSAIKKDGQKLYNLARKGKQVEIQPREIHIYRFEITEIKMPYVSFEVECSKGTYIRSLAFDFGKLLDSGAYLTALRRTKIGEFSVESSDNFWFE